MKISKEESKAIKEYLLTVLISTAIILFITTVMLFLACGKFE